MMHGLCILQLWMIGCCMRMRARLFGVTMSLVAISGFTLTGYKIFDDFAVSVDHFPSF
ncbi:hypothetical protein AQB9606_03952 [Aquabacterium sp. CECT 9606]|nr:hypothetical protein AQB9606_03952 [Aquabacterium sp. CECT 9606]